MTECVGKEAFRHFYDYRISRYRQMPTWEEIEVSLCEGPVRQFVTGPCCAKHLGYEVYLPHVAVQLARQPWVA